MQVYCGSLPSMKHGGKSYIEAWRTELDRAERVLGRIGPDDICCAGLTPRQSSILRILTQREGARLSDLAVAAEITPSAMTRVLEKLERQELVRRVRGTKADGRAAMVEITHEGRRVRARIDEMVCDRSQAIMSAIPERQRAQVLAALQLFNNALENSGCCGPNFIRETNPPSANTGRKGGPPNTFIKIEGIQPARRK